MPWNPIQSLIPYAAGKYGFTTSLKAIEVCHEFRRLAPKYLPGESEDNIVPRSYKEKVLTVDAADSSWAQTLQLHQYRILEEINKKYGREVISRIKIVTA